MRYLLDSNAWIAWLRQNDQHLVARIQQESPTELLLCSVVVGELVYGVERSELAHRNSNHQKVEQLRLRYASLAYDDWAAEEYGRARAHLTNLGQMIGGNDLMIAAIALANGLEVTHNTAEFSRVPGLTCEDWQLP